MNDVECPVNPVPECFQSAVEFSGRDSHGSR